MGPGPHSGILQQKKKKKTNGCKLSTVTNRIDEIKVKMTDMKMYFSIIQGYLKFNGAA